MDVRLPGGRLAWQRCTLCGGAREVDPDRYAAYQTGLAQRLDRRARGISLAEEAARLGITPQQLSRRERGEDDVMS